MIVCALCGVPVTIAKNGRLVHLDDIPEGFPAEHEIHTVPIHDFVASAQSRVTLKGAAESMLAHHGTLHPDSECQWADVLRRALASS